MATNLATKGAYAAPLLVHNRTNSVATELASSLGSDRVTAVSSPAEAIAPADIIFVILSNDAVVQSSFESFLATPGGVAGKLFVECSTIAPATTARVAERTRAAGAAFVAMPVFGAPAMAEAGSLLCVPAGAPEDVALVRQFTTGVLGRGIVDLSGKPPEHASRLKVVGNTMIGHLMTSLAEAHVLAEACGLGQPLFHEFVEKQFPGPAVPYSKRLVDGDYYQREKVSCRGPDFVLSDLEMLADFLPMHSLFST
jgi:3-hydroxyisobutyrate dehydrogenase-like beta-hydroxyacid dehydrogenase